MTYARMHRTTRSLLYAALVKAMEEEKFLKKRKKNTQLLTYMPREKQHSYPVGFMPPALPNVSPNETQFPLQLTALLRETTFGLVSSRATNVLFSSLCNFFRWWMSTNILFYVTHIQVYTVR